MTAYDKYWFKYYYSDGTVSDKPIQGKDAFLETHYRENDGWTFQNRGPETEICISFGSNMTCSKLEELIKKVKIDSKILPFLEDMIKKGKIQDDTFPDN